MNALNTWLRPLQDKLSARERLAVQIAALILIAFFTWWLLIAPAWRQIAIAPAERAALDQTLQTMQMQAHEAALLKTDTALIEANVSKTLQEATKAHLGAGSQTQVTGEKATVTVVATQAAGLAQWLGTARQNAHAKPIEAHLTQTGNLWGGTVVLALPAKAAKP
jgi:general secretion pathway protein M